MNGDAPISGNIFRGSQSQEGADVLNFRSDNCSPVLPEIMDALSKDMMSVAANGGEAYDDTLGQAVSSRFSEVFGTPLGVFSTVSGTGTNALAIATLLRDPAAPIFCHEEAHINVWEEQAALYLSRAARFVTLKGEHGKISARYLEAFIAAFNGSVTGGVLALTEPTELGAAYAASELRTLCNLCHARGMTVYVDGARLGAALAALDIEPAELIASTGIDAFSFGGTKFGCLAAEAVLFVRPDQELMERASRLHRASGQRLARRRFINVQLLRLLDDALWIATARRQNQACRSFVDQIGADERAFIHPVETNQVFIAYSSHLASELNRRNIKFTRWTDGSIRLVFCHSHTAEQVQELAAAINSVR